LIGDDEKTVGSAGNNFFAEKITTTAFDEGETGSDFVGAVNSKIQAAAFVEVCELDAVGAGEGFASVGTGDGTDVEAVVTDLFAEELDPERGCGTGAQAEGHTGLDEFHGPVGGAEFEFVVVGCVTGGWHVGKILGGVVGCQGSREIGRKQTLTTSLNCNCMFAVARAGMLRRLLVSRFLPPRASALLFPCRKT